MAPKPTYEELLQRVKELEQEKASAPARQADDKDSNLLSSIINIEELQNIMDDFFNLTGMVTAILDNNGKIIEQTGWQDLCTKFHRVHPETAKNCTESDLYLANNLKPGEHVSYKCKNGLWDVVTPLFIGEKHMGNIYTGQFFL